MEFWDMLLSIATQDEIDIGVISQFLRELPEKAWNLGVRVVLSLVVFFVGAQLIKLVRKIVKNSLQRGNADKGVVQFADSFVNASLYVLLVITIASGFGLDAASILALLGSAGVAIGLAIQGSLSNFVGGVLILLLKPFKVGDYIKEDSSGNEGTVTTIELFYTKLTTPDNRVIVLPNGTLSNSSLINVTACDSRRMDLTVGISYDSDIRLAKEALQKVLDEDEAVLKDKDHFVFVDSLAESSVNIGVRCWLSMEDFWTGKWRITENVKYALDNAGIIIPYPQLDVHLEEASAQAGNLNDKQ